ncbi:MAG: hypothetical protein ACRDHM_10160 [Actinomycetota bacterium]
MRWLRSIRDVRALLATLCAVLLTANCTSSEDASPRDEGRSIASPGSSSSPEDGVFVRTCESSVLGDLGAGWRRDAVLVGPVAFVGARGYENDPKRLFFARDPGMARAQKVLVVVDGDSPVVISLQTRDAALFYDPSKWGQSNRVPFRRGDEVTRFEPCTEDGQRGTQFNGGFLVRQPTCVRVGVQIEGEEPTVASLSFGAGACS